jgi:hypothetical protein
MRPESLSQRLKFEAEVERHETRRLSAMTPDERLAIVAALCSAGAKLLSMNDRRELILAHEEPLPASTLRALERLRREYSGPPR